MGSYPTFSPLPFTGGIFLWHFPLVRTNWALPSVLPYGARTFLSSVRRAATKDTPERTLYHLFERRDEWVFRLEMRYNRGRYVKRLRIIERRSQRDMIEKTSYDSPEYDVFKSNVKKLTGLDLNSYKNQIHRRVHMLMQRWSITSYDIYIKTIKENDQKLREFLDYLTINVSEFFRNPNKWTELQDVILPRLIQSRGKKQLKLWSAGSATGEEPYSLAILSMEAKLAPQTPVLASDIDQGAIAIAKRGHYLKRQLINIPKELVGRYFTTPDGGETYIVNSEVKSRVSFQRLNLIEDTFGDDFDLILCRNVVIYFCADTKTALYHKFFKALRPGGYLLVGSTEQIFDYRKIGFESAGAFLYQKPA